MKEYSVNMETLFYVLYAGITTYP
jgi:hypothetical protein